MDRGEADYFLGGYTINLFAALLLAVVVAVLAISHPDWPRFALYGAAIAAIVGFTLWFYPISRLLWLAFDLAFRGRSSRDFES